MGKNILNLSIIGAGAMGSAIASGIHLAQKKILANPEIKVPERYENTEIKLSICNRSQEKLDKLSKKIDFTAYEKIEEMISSEKPNLLIIAVKPKDISEILNSLKNISAECIIVSVLAGINIKTIEDRFPFNPIFRAMPNTPAQIGSGITALTYNKHCNDEHKNLVQKIFHAVGDVIFIDDENKMHAVTALSGSGPAYFFFLAEALIQAGINQGLNLEEASILVNKTFLGSGLLLNSSNEGAMNESVNSRSNNPSPETLRKAVTSPNGTTHAAISSLENNGFSEIINQAIQAASQRSKEFS
ncbi:MAG: pyrroline-5-carboxylate reductase [Cyanobacteria bacterium REEB446]|nr:pyrroline-5-carboxylate reductase [Cyanobacteria bacterium REEB446]